MGSAPSCKKYLVQPAENLRLDDQSQEKLLSNWSEQLLRDAVGKVAWKTSSWADLSRRIENQQAYFVQYLQEQVLPDHPDVAISGVHLIALRGSICPPGREQTAGAWSWAPDMTSRVWKHLDHEGHEYGGVSAVNAEAHSMRPIPALPSLEDLGLAERLQEVCDSASVNENAYVIKMSHDYCVTQYHPPHGPFKWESEMVLLKLCMETTRMVVLQVAADKFVANGMAQISATSISGETVATLALNLERDDTSSLLEGLAKAMKSDQRRLRLVFESGVVVDRKTAPIKLSGLLDAPGAEHPDSSNAADLHGLGHEFLVSDKAQIASRAEVAENAESLESTADKDKSCIVS
eukprot:TRINITY_DN29302_c0_g1_i1.p1 TRINITY_DN29302_c0_g1~~TRINITY_DN29302_c0_g1_i1.p1  ORF type:complete len:349 (+),score=48.16 TRINITY_DN29302_c0_g1_i1:31-1077(+)